MPDEQKNEAAAEPKAAEETPKEASEAQTEPAAEPAVEAVKEPAKEVAPPHAEVKSLQADELESGMTIRVHERIKDVTAKGEERERVQVFEGMVLAVRGSGLSRTMTVRKVTGGYGVEKIYPLNSPVIAKFELVKTAKVRRAKLWYLSSLKKRFRRKLKENWVK